MCQLITLSIRRLLGLDPPNAKRSIALPRVDLIEFFYELKAYSGSVGNNITFSKFIYDNRHMLRRMFGVDGVPDVFSEPEMIIIK